MQEARERNTVSDDDFYKRVRGWLARIKHRPNLRDEMEKNYSYVFPKIKKEELRAEFDGRLFWCSLLFFIFFLFVDTRRSTNN